MIALAHLVTWINTIKVQPLGDGRFLCSYYLTVDDWDIWVSKDDPRTRDMRFGGRA